MSHLGTTRLRWQLQRPDGSFDDPVQFAVDDDTAEYFLGLWEQIAALGRCRRRTELLADLRVQLDLFAVGARPVPVDSAQYRTLSRAR